MQWIALGSLSSSMCLVILVRADGLLKQVLHFNGDESGLGEMSPFLLNQLVVVCLK